MKRCGLKNVTYLFENCGNAKNQSIPYSTLQQAVVNTQVFELTKVLISLAHQCEL